MVIIFYKLFVKHSNTKENGKANELSEFFKYLIRQFC